MKASQNWRGERGAKETSGTPLWNLKNPEFTAFWLFFLVVYNVRMLLHGGGGGGHRVRSRLALYNTYVRCLPAV